MFVDVARQDHLDTKHAINFLAANLCLEGARAYLVNLVRLTDDPSSACGITSQVNIYST